jgi:hypothetical protein
MLAGQLHRIVTARPAAVNPTPRSRVRPLVRHRPLHLVLVDLFFRVAVLLIIVQVIEKLGEQRHPEWVIGEGGTVGQPGSDRGLSTAELCSAQAEG